MFRVQYHQEVAFGEAGTSDTYPALSSCPQLPIYASSVLGKAPLYALTPDAIPPGDVDGAL